MLPVSTTTCRRLEEEVTRSVPISRVLVTAIESDITRDALFHSQLYDQMNARLQPLFGELSGRALFPGRKASTPLQRLVDAADRRLYARVSRDLLETPLLLPELGHPFETSLGLLLEAIVLADACGSAECRPMALALYRINGLPHGAQRDSAPIFALLLRLAGRPTDAQPPLPYAFARLRTLEETSGMFGGDIVKRKQEKSFEAQQGHWLEQQFFSYVACSWVEQAVLTEAEAASCSTFFLAVPASAMFAACDTVDAGF